MLDAVFHLLSRADEVICRRGVSRRIQNHLNWVVSTDDHKTMVSAIVSSMKTVVVEPPSDGTQGQWRVYVICENGDDAFAMEERSFSDDQQASAQDYALTLARQYSAQISWLKARS